MEFLNAVQDFNKEFNLNAINDYNKYLQGSASFDFNTEVSDFEKTLEAVSKTVPINDKNDPSNLNNFMKQIGNSFSNGLNSVNDMRIKADMMQEDIATGGTTSIHDAMIAAEKADLSMQMAIQVRNRILNAYTEINSMSI